MMRVCSPQLGLSPKSYLGGEVHDYQLVTALAKYGINMKVLLPKGKFYKKNAHLEVEYLPFPFVYPPHLFNVLIIPYLIAEKKKGFDILRLHNPYFLGFAGAVLKKIYPDIKIVTTVHLKETRPDLYMIFSKTISIYDHIFTVSEYLKKWIVKEYKISPKIISVINNGVDPSIKILPRKPRKIDNHDFDGKLVLLNVGALIERKNVMFLLDVFEKLITKYPDLVLVFCGSGNQKQDLIRKIEEKRLEKSVFVFPPKFEKEKNELFNACDIFLFPSRNEGFGLVAAEAMMLGKPVIGADNTSIPELLVDSETGMLAKTNNTGDWCKQIEKLIKNEKLREEIGKRALKKAKKQYQWELVASKTLNVYKKLIK